MNAIRINETIHQSAAFRQRIHVQRRARRGPATLAGGAAFHPTSVTVLRLLFLAALVLVLLTGPAAGAEEVTLALDEAVALALDNHEGILVERASLAAAEAAVDGARGAYDPGFELAARWGEATDPIGSAFPGASLGQLAATRETADAGIVVTQLLRTGGALSLRTTAGRETNDGAFAVLSPAYTTRFGFELRQPLLRDRRIDSARFRVRAAAADRTAAGAALRREVNDTVAHVESAYWALVAARQAVEVRRDAVALAEEQLTETGHRIESGLAPETEIAQPRAELERRRGELLAADEALARAENALKRLILADAETPLWTSRLVPVEPAAVAFEAVDLAAALDSALAHRAELDAQRAQVDRLRIESTFARDGLRPALDAVVAYDRVGFDGSTTGAGGLASGGGFGGAWEGLGDGDYEDTRLGIVLGIAIGNRTARAAARGAEEAERRAAATLAGARKAVRAEVLDAAAAIDTAGQRIAAARAAREAAEVQLAAERERYAVGLSTNFLVLTRQNDLARARLDEISTLTDYRTARTEMARATGSLLAERGIALADVSR